MRTRYRWDPEQQKLVPISRTEGMFTGMIIGDLPDMKSPIDGTIIHGRRGLREHMKQHNVTFAQDFEGDWEKAKRRRQEIFEGKNDRRQRAEAIVHAIERLSRR